MKWVFLARWKTLQSLEISQVSHKERSWLSMTQLNLLAILKDIYFNTIFIWIGIVELAILICVFLSEACFLSICRITTLISWCDFFGNTGGKATHRKDFSLLVTLQRTALHTLADLYHTTQHNRKASSLQPNAHKKQFLVPGLRHCFQESAFS